MIISMTGFSSLNLVIPQKTEKNLPEKTYLTLTLKSLNSRFFEVNCKLPHALTHLETDFIKIFKSKLMRGSIYFTVHMSNAQALSSKVEPSLSIVAGYIDSIAKIKETFKISGDITISDLMRAQTPSVFISQEQPIDPEVLQIIINGINELIDALCNTRIKEGAMLAADLKQRMINIEQYFSILEARSEIVINEKKKQLIESLNAILKSADQSAALEAQSIVINNQLDKLDIHEEIVRFKSHFENLASIIDDNKSLEKGKKIDFTLQELFREINTIASKCSDANISKDAINIKVELEKAREQTQNIV